MLEKKRKSRKKKLGKFFGRKLPLILLILFVLSQLCSKWDPFFYKWIVWLFFSSHLGMWNSPLIVVYIEMEME